MPDVRRIVVLRGGTLGDLLYAMPALYALAAACPGAVITPLGSAPHAELLRDRPGPVDEVAVLPVTRTDRNEPAQRPRPTSSTASANAWWTWPCSCTAAAPGRILLYAN
ncbi:hypothetical protein IU471_07250 [Nocardia elegans]|uniref:glycosyltransferase family 9 protein n=1 Tax=Nocardia elegans TaxID=300029 RepID=UPI001893FC22|nr:hypothetical protein [Nocardia elegans]MBF6243378.1 hypothetical protein [Nocardia elegans]